MRHITIALITKKHSISITYDKKGISIFGGNSLVIIEFADMSAIHQFETTLDEVKKELLK